MYYNALKCIIKCIITCIIICKLTNVTKLFRTTWNSYVTKYSNETTQKHGNNFYKEMIQGQCILLYIYYNKYIFNTGETDEHQTILTCLEPSNS